MLKMCHSRRDSVRDIRPLLKMVPPIEGILCAKYVRLRYCTRTRSKDERSQQHIDLFFGTPGNHYYDKRLHKTSSSRPKSPQTNIKNRKRLNFPWSRWRLTDLHGRSKLFRPHYQTMLPSTYSVCNHSLALAIACHVCLWFLVWGKLRSESIQGERIFFHFPDPEKNHKFGIHRRQPIKLLNTWNSILELFHGRIKSRTGSVEMSDSYDWLAFRLILQPSSNGNV